LLSKKHFYQPPTDGDLDFKALFEVAASSGVGMPVDKTGFPVGPWTPELLTDAIYSRSSASASIEIRSVQNWFQVNNKGISVESIQKLAKVFGCGDPKATNDWSRALLRSRILLMSNRRVKQRSTAASSDRPKTVPQQLLVAEIPIETLTSKFVKGINRMAESASIMHVLILIWAGWAILAIAATILGVGHVSYNLEDGAVKEVGFYQTPTWTVEKTVLIPAYLLITSRGVEAWLTYRTASDPSYFRKTWEERIMGYRFTFIAVLGICFVAVFGLQWYGVFLEPILDGPDATVSPNWIRVTTNPLPLAPLGLVIPVSVVVGLYIGFVYWLCFTALLLLFVASHDMTDMKDTDGGDFDSKTKLGNNVAAQALVVALYRSAICAILMSLLVKLSIVYNDVDASSLIKWLVDDVLIVTGNQQERWKLIGGKQLAAQTSSMFLLISSSVAFLAIYRVKNCVEEAEKKPFVSHGRLWSGPIIMTLSFLLVGQFFGFSILFAVAVLIGLWELFRPSLTFEEYYTNETTTKESKSYE
jgi:hypothetical protein